MLAARAAAKSTFQMVFFGKNHVAIFIDIKIFALHQSSILYAHNLCSCVIKWRNCQQFLFYFCRNVQVFYKCA